jgi:hypothetical protein
MKIRLLAPAQWELIDAIQWYNEQKVGLGMEFLDQLDTSIRCVVAFPESHTAIEGGL